MCSTAGLMDIANVYWLSSQRAWCCFLPSSRVAYGRLAEGIDRKCCLVPPFQISTLGDNKLSHPGNRYRSPQVTSISPHPLPSILLTPLLPSQLRLGSLSGRPLTSTVHIHPTLNNTNEFGVKDAEISTISSARRKKSYFTPERPSLRKNTRGTEASWHSDIQFEEVPADYTSLRIVQLPENGGDTLWASGV